MVARMAGTVMNGPVPTMVDMLMEMALTRPSLRGRWAGAKDASAAFAPGRVVKGPVLDKETAAEYLIPPFDTRNKLKIYKALRQKREGERFRSE